jgi:gliding motility-associated-like protein
MPLHYHLQKKIWLSSILTMLVHVSAFCQQPVIKQVDKLVGSAGQVVTIKGSGFGNIAGALKVFFGAAEAVINPASVSDQLIEAQVPVGATFDKISVTNINSGLTGYSSESFLLSFSGNNGITAASFSAQTDFQAKDGLYDLCLCDIDADGKKIDIATTASEESPAAVAAFQNTSAISALSFSTKTINLSNKTLHIACGDLDGDGKSDIVLSDITPLGPNSALFILKNNGALPPTIQTITVIGQKAKRVKISDVDMDGKPEIIVSDINANNISIFRNQSTIGAISFTAPTTISIPGAVNSDGLIVEDVNGDGRPDILASQFIAKNVSILKNGSTPGNISFTIELPVPTATAEVQEIRLADVDGDLKPDLVITENPNASISIFLNQSSSSSIGFGAANIVPTDKYPWGLDFGDLDGDKKMDIVVASVNKASDPIPTKSLTILNNNSTIGNVSFSKLILPTTYVNRHVKIGDMDGDGKPDIVFTSINFSSTKVSKISIIRNKNCMVPEITPVGPLTICSGLLPLTLNATQGATTYTWTDGTTVFVPSAASSLNVSASGSYKVSATSEGGTCVKSSQSVNITVVAGSAVTPMASNTGPFCIGSAGQVVVTNPVVGIDYKWTGPDGFAPPLGASASILNFSLAKAGVYKVEAIISGPGGCTAGSAATVVASIDTPSFTIGLSGSGLFCSGTKTLTISPSTVGFTSQWYDQNGIRSEVLPSISVSNSGDYFAKLTSIANPTCPIPQTNTVIVKKLSDPVAAFSSPPQACTGQLITLIDQSTFDSQSTLEYAWDLGDGRTFTVPNPPPFSYISAGPRTIKLTVSYPGGLCQNSTQPSINIIAAPPISIATAANIFDVCPEKELPLTVNGGPFTSYLWSNGETSPSIMAKGGATISVIVKNTIGCELNASKAITLFPAPVVVATAKPTEIGFEETTQLNVTGLNSYTWSPAESLSNAGISNPTAKPTSSTTYTVTGIDGNSCVGIATVEVRVKGENIVDLLTPSNFFSPNGDAESPTWVVENILKFACSVSIFDDKGVKVFESDKYDNSWDGTFKGKVLPDGVYYYLIRCDDKTRTGSITLLR